jgi:cytochrome c551/c552
VIFRHFVLSAALAAAAPEQAVRILEKNCWSCHGPTVALSGLRLDSRDALEKGGRRGSVLKDDLLVRAISRQDTRLVMPPTEKLADADIGILKDWVAAGAVWPRTTQVSSAKWWSFIKPVSTPGANVDSFIDKQLAARKITAAPPASRRTLIRRATFDLHGLAPTQSEFEAFEKDASSKAYETLIDRLLASPRYGEKWGKHWLDLARYGDTAGFEQDPYTLYAWRYRDYVIKAFNDDKPYDRFIKETIAGDELFEDPESQQGTGFYSVGPNRDMLYKVEDINRIESLTDFVDTTSSVFLGLSVGCARCHDHKYDPIPQRDYYRMQAIFAPFQKNRVFLHYNNARGYDLSENTRTFKLYEYAAEIQAIKAPYQAAIRKETIAKFPKDVQDAFHAGENDRTPTQRRIVEQFTPRFNARDNEVMAAMSAPDKERLRRAEQRIVSLYSNYQPGPFSPGLTDVGRESPRTYVPVKGVPPPGEEVGPGLLSALGGKDLPDPPLTSLTTQRRSALANWIASADNPLTARVMVNRVWHYHFGRGLVATPSDFGSRGAAPTHPELLDTLSADFMRDGWSLKKLHKRIMLSAAYQRSSKPAAGAVEKDPENQWLARYSRRRLEAEEIRDAVLQAAGTLSTRMYGRPVVPEQTTEELYGMSQGLGNAWVVTADKAEHNRRTIYMISRRNFRMPLLEVFDRPDGVLSCSRRESSTTAPQSLSLLNSRFTQQQAAALAETASKQSDPAAFIFERILSRVPSADERAMAAGFLAKQTALTSSAQTALTEFARGLLNINEFLYVE